jgi:hypothetical protein
MVIIRLKAEGGLGGMRWLRTMSRFKLLLRPLSCLPMSASNAGGMVSTLDLIWSDIMKRGSAPTAHRPTSPRLNLQLPNNDRMLIALRSVRGQCLAIL